MPTNLESEADKLGGMKMVCGIWKHNNIIILRTAKGWKGFALFEGASLSLFVKPLGAKFKSKAEAPTLTELLKKLEATE